MPEYLVTIQVPVLVEARNEFDARRYASKHFALHDTGGIGKDNDHWTAQGQEPVLVIEWKELKKAAPPEPKQPVIPKPPPSRRPPIQEEIF